MRTPTSRPRFHVKISKVCARTCLMHCLDLSTRHLQLPIVTMADIKFVEVVGGAWRVPKVQQILSSHFKSGESSLPLGQHLNGEEAGAMGAALVAANSSSSFRVKKIFFSDISAHEYAVQVTALDGTWEKNLTVLYPVGSALGSKKKLSFTMEEDFKVKVFENTILVSEYSCYRSEGPVGEQMETVQYHRSSKDLGVGAVGDQRNCGGEAAHGNH